MCSSETVCRGTAQARTVLLESILPRLPIAGNPPQTGYFRPSGSLPDGLSPQGALGLSGSLLELP